MAAPRVHFRAGFAVQDITPDLSQGPVELTGFVVREQPALAVRAPLLATALVLGGADQEPVALVALDTCIVGEAALARILAACPLPPERVLVHASHTHATPGLYRLVGCGEMSGGYVEFVAERVGRAVRQALELVGPCRVGWGRLALPAAPWHNRREAGGPTDPRVQILKIERADSTRTPVCALWSVPCHPVVLGSRGREVSSDLVGEVRRRLPWPSLFVQGFAGDQNPRALGEEGLGVWGPVAEAVAQLWSATPTAPAGWWGLERRSLMLPRGRGDPVANLPVEGRPALAMRAWAAEIARPGEAIPPSAAELTVLRIHGGSIAFWPGEPHVRHALDLPPDCLAVGHTGASLGYIPDEQAYPRGGYEVDVAHRYYGFPSALAPEAGPALRAATAEMLAALGR